MNITTKERLISQIVWGHTSAVVKSHNGDIISLYLRPPTPEEQAKASRIYSVELSRAIYIGLPTEEKALNDLIEIGRWSVKQEAEIDGLYTDIHNIRKGLLDFVFNVTKLEQARSLLRRAEKALVDRLNLRHSLLQCSAEAHAEICRQHYLIGVITENENGSQFWKTIDDFNEYDDQSLVNQLCEAFFQTSRIPVVAIRELAKSQQWRTYWDIAKNTNDLFEGPIVSWSLDQRELAYWSTVYDSVYSAYERPSKEIINDDDLLDSWFIRQGDKIEGVSKKESLNAPLKNGRNEQFIMSDREGAKKVYSMNSPASRARVIAKQKLLERKGTIKEQDMPDSQNEMRKQLATMTSKKAKSINSR